MEKTKLLSLLLAAKVDRFASAEAYKAFENLKQALIDDVRAENNKKNGAAKVEKVLKDILKFAANENYNDMMQYSYISDDGAQWALDGHRMIKIFNPIDAPLWGKDNRDAENEKRAFYDVKSIWNRGAVCDPDLLCKTPDFAALKTYCKLNKKARPIITLENARGELVTINALWLLNALENLQDVKIYTSENGASRAPVWIVSKEAELLILPINSDTTAAGLYCIDKCKEVKAA